MQNEEKNANAIGAGIIAATAARTVFWLLAVVALALAFVRIAFPLAAMRMYDDLGNTPRAYDCASQAARTYSGVKGVNAKLAAVNYAIALYAEHDGYAAEVASAAEAFLSDPACLDRAAKVDEYNLSASPRSIHPNLYSFIDYLYGCAAGARYVLGEPTVRLGGKTFTLGEAADMVASGDSELTPDEKAIVLGEAAAILGEAYSRNANMSFVPADKLKEAAAALANSAAEKLDGGVTLHGLYLLKAAEKVSARLELAGLHGEVQAGGRGITELYKEKLEKYKNEK